MAWQTEPPTRGGNRRVDPVKLVDASPDILFVLDSAGLVLHINRAGREALGLVADHYIGRSMLEFLHPDDTMLGISSLVSVQSKPIGTPIEVRINTAGEWRWYEVVGRSCVGEPGIDGVVLGARDITQRRMWEIAANDTARFQQILHNAAALVLCLDAEGIVTAVNGALTRLLGVDPSIAIGRHLATLAAPGHAASIHDAIARAGSEGTVTVEVPLRHVMTGVDVPVRFEIVDLLDDPVVRGLVVTGQDVSELDAVRRRLEHLATHDPLTGLSNRPVLEERLARLVEAGRPLALLYVDLDHFKPVNDTHGHDIGDEVLRAAARRLTDGVGDGDLVTRVGGDEFVVVALGVADRAAAVALAERLRAVLVEPYRLRVGTVTVGASVGVVVSTPDSTASALLAEADLAMYAAKAARPDPGGQLRLGSGG